LRSSRSSRSTVAALALAGGVCLVAACSPPGNAGAIIVTASGEALGQNGFPFPPDTTQSPYFIDGWSVSFEQLIVTFDNIVVSEAPDKSASDQSLTGPAVATLQGPFAVDLHKPGTIPGKEDGTTAFPLGRITNQNRNNGDDFKADAKYAFGYDVVVAQPNAVKVNFDATTEVEYADMARHGYSVLYVGTAKWMGAVCKPAAGTDKTLDGLPTTVRFRFGFKTRPRFVNCQNPDLGDDAKGGNPRGLAMKPNADVTAQMTIHADHPFWDARQEDSPLRFDAIAVVAKQKNLSVVTLEDLEGVPYLPITVNGVTLPSRTCEPAPSPVAKSQFYDPKGATFTDLASFISDRQGSQGHLNADGLCFVATQ
jgi:hypothetical protein